MNEKTLLSVSLVIVCVGLVVLYAVSSQSSLDQTTIDAIDKKSSVVNVQGKVTDVFSTNATTILTLSQPSTIKVMVFEPLNVSEGSEIEVIGRVEEYQGEEEIIAVRVRQIT